MSRSPHHSEFSQSQPANQNVSEDGWEDKEFKLQSSDDDDDDDELLVDFDERCVDDWIDGLLEIESCFPAELRYSRAAHQQHVQHSTSQIEHVYACGILSGVWHGDGVSHHVFISIIADPSPVGCTCQESEGIYVCPHNYQFVLHALRQLQRDRSLISRIERGATESGQPDLKSLLFADASTLAIAKLHQLVADTENDSPEAADQDDDWLPEVVEQTQQRVVWNLHEGNGGHLSIQPLLQQKKKRGDGFTKGRLLALDQLMADRSLPLSAADRAVVSKIKFGKRVSSHYYGANQYSLDPFDAVEQLIDQDNVVFNHEPIVVQHSPAYLVLASSKDSHRVFFCDETGTRLFNRVAASSSAILRIDTQQHEIWFGKVTDDESTLIRSLIHMPPLALDRREELIEPLQKLRKQLSILLPATLCGAVVIEAARPVILLRSQNDGRLDFGIRVRDAGGVLRRPLSGPMVTAVERDGKTIQSVRSAKQETLQIGNLLRHWQLQVNQETWFGTIDDFGDALRLIEDLQSPDSLPDGKIEILWDRHNQNRVNVLGSLHSSNVKVEISNKRNWFGISGECSFGEHTIPLADVIQHLSTPDQQGVGDYIKLGDGQWAKISAGLRQRLQRLQAATHSDHKTLKLDATSAPAIRDIVGTDIAVKASRAWEKCVQRLANAEKLDPSLPKNLVADLRGYQVDGYKWLRKLAEWGVGGILADDMGLGKTLQTLAVLLDRAADGPALVIAPTSVGFNWAREAQRFAPDLDVHLYRETERGEFLPTVGPNSLVICSYGLALRDAKALSGVAWSTLVLDEAQAIKNSRSKTSKAIAAIDADWTVALTGTPVENHLGELWSLFHVVSPGVLGGWEQFRRRYAAPIEKEGNQAARLALASRLQPFVLRRTKKEVLTELPPRTEMNLYVDLSDAERAEYEQIRRLAIGEIESIESLPQIQDQRFKILALMTRLRQIACHVALVNKQWKHSSAKLDQLCETLESLREEGHRALVFSQFTEHLALIRAALDERGFTYEYLDGSTPPQARQVAVDRFQTGDANAFLISLKAGGTGLNLTAADYVIHMDPWWNPAVEDQATDRAHRMGQDKPVMVYRIVARGTIEEEILALHDSKRDLVAGVMQGTEAAAKLSNEDLIRMLRG